MHDVSSSHYYGSTTNTIWNQIQTQRGSTLWIWKNTTTNQNYPSPDRDRQPIIYILDLKSIQEAQFNNKGLTKIVKITSQAVERTIQCMYTYKTIEDIELVHKNDQIIVP